MTDDQTTQKMQLLTALVSNPDVQAAATTAGVSRTTAYRWLQEDDFKDELKSQRDAVLSVAMESVKTHAARAVTELAGLLCSKDDRLRRQVCNDLLAHAIKIRELDDLEARLTALEKALAKKEKGAEA
jgi:hypothetical protein